MSDNPKCNQKGHRPIKRAKRPYKSKGKPLALTQAENARLNIEKSTAERKTKLLDTLTSGKRDYLKATRGFEKARVLRVLLAGATAQQVATELKLPLKYCETLINDLENEIKTIGKEEFVSLLWRKVRGFMDDHTAINASLELLLFQVDTDLRLITGRLDGLLDRIEEHKDQAPPAGMAYDTARAEWQAMGNALASERQVLMTTRQGLRTEKTALQREKRANNKDFVQTLTMMGVTSSPPPPEKEVPLHSPVSANLADYSGLGEGRVVALLEESQKEVGRYLKNLKKSNDVGHSSG